MLVVHHSQKNAPTGQRQTEHQGVTARHHRTGQRTAFGAFHHLVDVRVGNAVQGVGTTGGEHPVEQRAE